MTPKQLDRMFYLFTFMGLLLILQVVAFVVTR